MIKEVKDHYLLFKDDMVLAMLREIESPGTGKTETRRIIDASLVATRKHDGLYNLRRTPKGKVEFSNVREQHVAKNFLTLCPYKVRDRIVVKETWCTLARFDGVKPTELPDDAPVLFAADNATLGWRDSSSGDWSKKMRASMFLPRRFSRMTLVIDDVAVSRLCSIDKDAALREGIVEENGWYGLPGMPAGDMRQDPVDAYLDLWDRINAGRANGFYKAVFNPWVISIRYRPIPQNIDDVPTVLPANMGKLMKGIRERTT